MVYTHCLNIVTSIKFRKIYMNRLLKLVRYIEENALLIKI